MTNNVLVLTLDSNAFEDMKEDFNSVLKKTLGNMQVKESNEATLTLKLCIKLDETDVPDYEACYENATRKAYKPRFDHKISSVMQIKSEESGSLKGEYELVWDDDLQDYVMKPINDGQMKFEDDDYYYETSTVSELPPAIPLIESSEDSEFTEYDDSYLYDEDVV